jgi:hypothetical protein
MTYKLFNDLEGNTAGVQLLTKQKFIPFDEANRDYKEYLEWLAAGNTPEPADS